MGYTTQDKVEGLIGTTLNLTGPQWASILEQTDLMIDAYLPESYLDNTIHVIEREPHYDITEEFMLKNPGVVMLDSIIVQFRDRTGWAEHMIDPQAYRWFPSGLVLIASPYINYTPNIFLVSYRYRTANSDIPHYVKAAATMMAASLVLAQPKSIVTPETLDELAQAFGGDMDKIRSLSLEGISISFDSPSAKAVLDEMFKTMKETSKTYREQAIQLLKAGVYKPRFN